MKMLEASIKRAVRLRAIGAYQHHLANLEDRRSPEFAGRWAMRGPARTAGMLLFGMLRQFVFGHLAGYEGVNDAERLRHDRAMRWRQGTARRCSRDEPDGPLRDPAALGCQELVCSHVPFGPMDRRVADTSWQWRI